MYRVRLVSVATPPPQPSPELGEGDARTRMENLCNSTLK